MPRVGSCMLNNFGHRKSSRNMQLAYGFGILYTILFANSSNNHSNLLKKIWKLITEEIQQDRLSFHFQSTSRSGAVDSSRQKLS